MLHAQSATMLTVNTAPVVSADQWSEWQLIFWLGDAFDYQTPFRAALDEIAFTLAQSKPTTIDLPDFAEGEDFVEGHLSFGGTTVSIYYEHSLGYLTLSNQDRRPLDEIEALTRPVTQVR